MRLSKRAYNEIKHKIISLKLPPLAVINEHALMSELGLGRTPIREAVHRLAAENLVVIAPRRGTFVAEISITDLQMIFEVRRPLESLCARLAAERSTPDEAQQLEDIFEELQRIDLQDVDAVMAVDRRFHKALYRCSQNEYLWEPLDRLHALSLRLWYVALGRVPDLVDSVAPHLHVARAVRAHDAQLAETLINQQLVEFQEIIKSVI